MGFKIGAAVTLLAAANAALAQDAVTIQNGFVTGETYLSLDSRSQIHYAVGVVDGLLLSPLLGAPTSKTSWLTNCLVNMTGTQVAAVLKKRVQDHPETWHQSAHTQLYAALAASCPGSPLRHAERSE